MLRITIVCDQFDLEDVSALGQYLRDRYKDSAKEINVLVAADQFPAAQAVAALKVIFGHDPNCTGPIRLQGEGGNGKN